MLGSTGADRVIDYTREDFTQHGQRYDLIFDVATKRTFSDCKHVLSPNGTYITTAFSPVLALGDLWTSVTGDKRMAPVLPKPPNEEDRAFIRELLEGGKAARFGIRHTVGTSRAQEAPGTRTCLNAAGNQTPAP
jgi:NADPH:quinone reductase-like Zn-dependent oxidoreductase